MSIGGFLWSPRSQQPRFFFWQVPEAVLATWRAHQSQEQLIHEAELFPVWVSSVVWGSYLSNALVLRFVDNDAARFNLIRGFGRSRSAASLVHGFWQEEARLRSKSWIERVESSANPGDAPSRRRYWDILDGAVEDAVENICFRLAEVSAGW